MAHDHHKPTHNLSARCCAGLLCLTMAAAIFTPAAGAEAPEIPASCDEAYYATLDYYGALQEGSIVKSYNTRGASTLVDYGTYDQVVNLTDGTAPETDAGSFRFNVSGTADGRFYFEGKTSEPYERLPWRLSVHYRLNGVDVPAEQLAGQTGVAEINIDAVPNPSASAYVQNNFVLEAAALFNADDIVSLEAPGAQIQLIGNLRAVLFMALPGQEAHFTIRVGAEDFSFGGLTFMMEPATLMQLDEISTLRDAKDDIEGAYDDLDASLEAILNALDGMSGSLNATANGLDQLNDARSQISAGKSGIYQSADSALAGLAGVSEAMQPIGGYLDTASQALTETTDLLTQLSDTAVGIKPQLENTRKLIAETKDDVENLHCLLNDFESYNKEAQTEADDLRDDLDALARSVSSLDKSLAALKGTLSYLQQAGISPINSITIPVSDGKNMTIQELAAAIGQASSLKQLFETLSAQEKAAMGCPDYESYVELMLLAEGIASAQGMDVSTPEAKQQSIQAVITSILAPMADPAGGKTYLSVAEGLAGDSSVAAAQDAAADLYALLQAASTEEFQSQLTQAKVFDNLIGSAGETGTINGTISEVNAMLAGLLKPTAALVGNLESLCDSLNSKNGLNRHLDDVLSTIGQLLDDCKDHEGDAGALLDDLNSAGTILSEFTASADSALDLLDQLDDTLNTYEPTAQSALQDGKKLADSASSGIASLKDCLKALENLMQRSGVSLDAGTQQTLSGLAAALRHSTVGLTETDSIRDAKDIITSRIEDEWNTYTGEDNNLLLMDPDAPMVSLTSEKNPSPASVQVIMRTQEIKQQTASAVSVAASASQEQPSSGGFWSRVAQMFQDLWHALTAWMH